MKVALLGYGRMGKMIDEVATHHGAHVVARVDTSTEMTKESLQGADVCIDFSTPEAALRHIGLAAEYGVDIVVGTTGWHEELSSVKGLVTSSKIGLLHSPNFSIGMQIFAKVAKETARLCDQIGGYDAAGYELHHRGKGDSPSGSGIALAEGVVGQIKEKSKPNYERQKAEILPNHLHFASVRCGHIPGTHTLLFDSPQDTIEMTHRARTREGFAIGAIKGAQWLKGKHGVFTLDEMIDSLMKDK